jgi:hypothetical protein
MKEEELLDAEPEGIDLQFRAADIDGNPHGRLSVSRHDNPRLLLNSLLSNCAVNASTNRCSITSTSRPLFHLRHPCPGFAIRALRTTGRQASAAEPQPSDAVEDFSQDFRGGGNYLGRHGRDRRSI